MILRLVLGLNVACPGFATTGVSTESRRSLGLDPGVGGTTAAPLCMGVAAKGVELDSNPTVFTEAVVDGVGDTCVILTSEDGLGDSGFEGRATVKINVQQILSPLHCFNKGWGT